MYLTTTLCVCVCVHMRAPCLNTHLLSCCHIVPKSLTLKCHYIMKHSQILITTGYLNDTNRVCFLNKSTPEILFLYSLSESSSDKNFEMQMWSKECQLENCFSCNPKSVWRSIKGSCWGMGERRWGKGTP